MTLATTFLAATLFVPNMPPPDFDDCEVITNCVFDASRQDAKVRGSRLHGCVADFVGRNAPKQSGSWPVAVVKVQLDES